MRRRHPKNIRPWKGGWQTYIEVSGQVFYQSWPANASLDDMRDWVTDHRRDWKIVGPKRGSFAADVADYTARIASTSSARQLGACLDRWLAELGKDRPRRSIKAAEIDQALQRMAAQGMGPTSRQKHRMVLMALWNRLDGKDAPNPVRAIPRPSLPKPEARGVSYQTIRHILEQLPIRTEKQRAAKRRLTVIAYTGIPPAMLAQITADDLHLTGRTVRVSPRRKGHGVEARTLPLARPAVTAFHAFHKGDDYGPFRVDLLSRAFKRAARRAGAPSVRLYDLRHSFATALYRQTKDLETVARFLQHSTTALTARYAKGASEEIDRCAASALGRSLSRHTVPQRKRPMKKRKRS